MKQMPFSNLNSIDKKKLICFRTIFSGPIEDEEAQTLACKFAIEKNLKLPLPLSNKTF
jgi:hypothetical protein